jgi:hypothetical protein
MPSNCSKEEALKDLEEVINKTAILLKEKEIGFFTWWECLNSNITKINECAKVAGISIYPFVSSMYCKGCTTK